MYKELLQKSKALNVLYAEDDINLRDATISFLGEFFNRIDAAENGEAALALYEKKVYDIVISDISMPVMDGIELCRRIKEINGNQQIIITSAHDDITYMTELVRIGVGHFIGKPMEMGVIVNVLNGVCTIANYARSFYLCKMRNCRLNMLNEMLMQREGDALHEKLQPPYTLSGILRRGLFHWGLTKQGEPSVTLHTEKDSVIARYGDSMEDMLFVLLNALQSLTAQSNGGEIPLVFSLHHEGGLARIHVTEPGGVWNESSVDTMRQALYARSPDFASEEVGLFFVRKFVETFLEGSLSLVREQKATVLQLAFPAKKA